jgi:ATP-dependent Clp protease ATP-binding subunit ClpA
LGLFERYSADSKRVIFYSRFAACDLGSPKIGPEHLLLGLLREDHILLTRFLDAESIAAIAIEIERNAVRQPVDVTGELRLTQESQRALNYGTEEAVRCGDSVVGTTHLLIGLMREPGTVAARILHECGLDLATLRECLQADPPGESPT